VNKKYTVYHEDGRVAGRVVCVTRVRKNKEGKYAPQIEYIYRHIA
jgi:hypothetical protein